MLSSALLLAIRSLSAACAPLDVPSFDLIGFWYTVISRPCSWIVPLALPMLVSHCDEGTADCDSTVDVAWKDCVEEEDCSNGFAILSNALLLAARKRSAVSAPLDVPSFDLTGF